MLRSYLHALYSDELDSSGKDLIGITGSMF
jgi:hypothetical protein